jgi:ribulose-phosphate 3-epimerase
MSVEPGFGGQKFMPSALDKLRWLKSRLKPGTFASVDGGIDLETIGDVAAAGANIFVTGSAIFEAGDYGQAMTELAGRAKAAAAATPR